MFNLLEVKIIAMHFDVSNPDFTEAYIKVESDPETYSGWYCNRFDPTIPIVRLVPLVLFSAGTNWERKSPVEPYPSVDVPLITH